MNKSACDIIEDSFEKIAKQMPYLLSNGDYATPRGWESKREEDEFDQEYFRVDHKIPKNYKRIADDGYGNSTFVDVNSDKNNPDYYDWDHETTQLTKWDDKEKQDAFTLPDKENEVYNKLKNSGIISGRDINNMSVDQLKSFGYIEKEKPKFLDKAKKVAKGIYNSPITQAGAAFGSLGGMTLSDPNNLRQVAKKGGLGLLAGAALGAAVTGGINAWAGDYRKLNADNTKDEIDKFKYKLRTDYYDGVSNQEFKDQYKIACDIISDIEKQAAFNVNGMIKTVGNAVSSMANATKNLPNSLNNVKKLNTFANNTNLSQSTRGLAAQARNKQIGNAAKGMALPTAGVLGAGAVGAGINKSLNNNQEKTAFDIVNDSFEKIPN